MRAWITSQPVLYQQAVVAHHLDRTGALSIAFQRGEKWAIDALCNMKALDYHLSLLVLLGVVNDSIFDA